MKVTLYAMVQIDLEVDENHGRFQHATDYPEDVAAEILPDVLHSFSAPPDVGYKVVSTEILDLLSHKLVNPLEDQ